MNYKKNMKNFLCLLRRLFPTAPANSPAKPAGSNTLPRSGYACSDNGNPSIALHWSFFIFVPFTRRHRVPRAHINSNKFNAVLCTLIHFMNTE